MSTELRDRRDHAPDPTPLPPRLLAAIASGWAATADPETIPAPAPGTRAYLRLLASDRYDVWLIRWGIDSEAPLHDHAGSAGALQVVAGELTEETSGIGDDGPQGIASTRGRSFGPGLVHEVRNTAEVVATSVHVYSPPLRAMTYYARTGGPLPVPLFQMLVTDDGERCEP